MKAIENCDERVKYYADQLTDVNFIVISEGSPLTAASLSGSLETINLLLNRGANVNMEVEYTPYGSALAAAAATRGSLEIITALLDAGAKVDMQLHRCSYSSALAAAAACGPVENIKALLDAGADVDMQLPEGSYGSALATAAAACGSVEKVNALLQGGADANMQLHYGDYGSALAAAAAAANRGSLEIITALLDAGAKVDMQLHRCSYGSALAAAAACGPVENIKALLDAGADVDMQLPEGSYGSALATAAACGSVEKVNALLQRGADANMQLHYGGYGSALVAAAVCGSVETVNALLQRGADANMQLHHGGYSSALVAAAVRGSVEKVNALLQRGADANMELHYGDYGSALVAAAVRGSVEKVNALLQGGADASMQLHYGDYGSALVAAASRGTFMHCEAFLKAGADPNMQVRNGLYGSALAAAAAANSEFIDNVVTLLQLGADVNMQLHYGDFGSALAAADSAIVASYLLQAGADVNMEIVHGSYRSALAAALHRSRDSIEILLNAGARRGIHPLATTIKKGSSSYVRSSLKAAMKTAHGNRVVSFDWEFPSVVNGITNLQTHISDMGTLTRTKDTVLLATCHDFLRGAYGDLGTRVLDGVMRALGSSEGYYLDSNFEIQTSSSHIYLHASDQTPDAQRILEWICLTFREQIQYTLGASTMTEWRSRYSLNDLNPLQDVSGSNECWHQLFETGVVAFEMSDQQRLPCHGLELNFKQLLRLSAVEYPVAVDSGLVLLGYSTSLVPIKLTDDGKLMWHLEVATDDFQLEVSDLRATRTTWLRNTNLEYLQSKRAILGWCSEAETLLGTDRLGLNVTMSDAKIKPTSWHWSGANLQLVAQSASPLALGGQMGLSFDRCINTLRFNPSNNYLKCLSNSAKQQIVLYDVKAKRAWLVSLLSVLHHMLLVWSKTIHKDFRAAPAPTAQPGHNCNIASLKALRDQGGLVLDASQDEDVTVRDLIMGFSVNLSKAILQPPKGSRIYGYEFMDIVMDSPESELKKSKLEKEGLAWIPLLHKIKCLFCSDLGDAIIGKRSPLPHSPCNSMIKGYDMMAASIQSIETITVGIWRGLHSKDANTEKGKPPVGAILDLLNKFFRK
ncbi:hypothetical protein N7457_002277 [Penicillium paradoxum]|uniref:uncharacterized protein n=1 Tax=Penicillium paradoxum TaxID=176176 RepID=UPI00254660E5|nr:uncharacterized protein N7457_002277 [Penicillium paradoxum]KAJ5787287.1 hypothetical protein N7457_002277 [Penicillium paradoxum]